MKLKPLTPFVMAMICAVFASTLFAEELEAVLQWQRVVSMSTPVSGVVVEVDAVVGQRVNKGHVLVRLDDRSRQAQVEALTAKLKSAENNRNETQKELDRTQELYDRTLISNHELELARIQRDDGEAHYKGVKASLAQANMDLQYSTIRAPFSAWVMQRNVEVGQTIVSELQALPLIVLVDASQMIAHTEVSSSKMEALRIGHQAKVIVGDAIYQGSISDIGLSPSQGSADKYPINVSFSVGDKMYRAGQPAIVRF